MMSTRTPAEEPANSTDELSPATHAGSDAVRDDQHLIASLDIYAKRPDRGNLMAILGIIDGYVEDARCAATALAKRNIVDVKAIHAAVLSQRLDPRANKHQQFGFQTGLHSAAAAVARFSSPAAAPVANLSTDRDDGCTVPRANKSPADPDSGLRVVRYIEMVDKKLEAEGLSLEHRRAVVSALMDTGVDLRAIEQQNITGSAP
jgi:hypothetical protein